MRRVIRSQGAPLARGAYSQGWRAGNFVFVSGQVPIDPQSKKIVEGPFREQAKRTLKNVEAVLAAEGATLSDVVKFTVILADLANFDELNAAFQEVLGEPMPARTTFRADLRGVPIEIDAIAYTE